MTREQAPESEIAAGWSFRSHREVKLRRLDCRRSGVSKRPQSRQSLGAGPLQSRKLCFGRFDLRGKLFLAGHNESIVAPAGVLGKPPSASKHTTPKKRF